MDTWYKFLLEFPTQLQIPSQLQLEFAVFYKMASDEDVRGAAVLSKFHRNGSMIYFSPQASKIAQPLLKKYNAQPCDKPSMSDDTDGHLLCFLVGDNGYFTDNFHFDPSKVWH